MTQQLFSTAARRTFLPYKPLKYDAFSLPRIRPFDTPTSDNRSPSRDIAGPFFPHVFPRFKNDYNDLAIAPGFGGSAVSESA
jgi:hypothetical protein